MAIKPIETYYNNYKFRSRLEARWACFFDAAKIKYEYEYAGWNLHGTYYLPDFWLPELDCWVEAKGTDLTFDPIAYKKLATLTTQENWLGLALIGTPDHLQHEHYGYYGGMYIGRTSFAACLICGKIGLLTIPHKESFKIGQRLLLPPYLYRLRCNCRNEVTFPFTSTNSKVLDDAFVKARQARFEFGESG